MRTRFRLWSFEEGAAERLVGDLLKIKVVAAKGEATEVEGEFAEPVQLQLVCRSLCQDLPPDVTVITLDHLRTLGDVNQVLSGFYEGCIERAAQETGVKEGDLRGWFEHALITPAGTRGTVYRGREKTSGIPNAAVDVFETWHLIRAEWRAGARWYELTHDRFIEPVLESNHTWRLTRQPWWSRLISGWKLRRLSSWLSDTKRVASGKLLKEKLTIWKR